VLGRLTLQCGAGFFVTREMHNVVSLAIFLDFCDLCFVFLWEDIAHCLLVF
jgi:hypothetical protein